MDHNQKFKRDKSTYKGILFSLKRKGKSDTGYNVDKLEDIVLREISQ